MFSKQNERKENEEMKQTGASVLLVIQDGALV